jgi:hypothetical protein
MEPAEMHDKQQVAASRASTADLIDRYLGVIGFATFVIPVLGGLYLATRFLSAGVYAQPWAILSTYSPQDLATYGVPMAIVPLLAFIKLNSPRAQIQKPAAGISSDRNSSNQRPLKRIQKVWSKSKVARRLSILALLLATLTSLAVAPLYVAIVASLQLSAISLFARYAWQMMKRDLTYLEKRRRIVGAATAYFSLSLLAGVTLAGANSFTSSEVVFQPEVQTPKSGEYIVLNPGHDPVYLGMCRDNKITATVQVAREHVVSTTSRRHSGPENNHDSLWNVIRGNGEYQIGATVRCVASPGA